MNSNIPLNVGKNEPLLPFIYSNDVCSTIMVLWEWPKIGQIYRNVKFLVKL
jgi:hypothetical protein